MHPLVAKFVSIMILMEVVAIPDLQLYRVDVKITIRNSKVKDEIHASQLYGMEL